MRAVKCVTRATACIKGAPKVLPISAAPFQLSGDRLNCPVWAADSQSLRRDTKVSKKTVSYAFYRPRGKVRLTIIDVTD